MSRPGGRRRGGGGGRMKRARMDRLGVRSTRWVAARPRKGGLVLEVQLGGADWGGWVEMAAAAGRSIADDPDQRLVDPETSMSRPLANLGRGRGRGGWLERKWSDRVESCTMDDQLTSTQTERRSGGRAAN